ncbi:MAG TPA: biosynthetic-type acetolactate synthase large subunit [Ruminococcus sp.]|nr:biosynthetic-type acetolactate synthase large subunit [Ruminococcus sp.]HCR73964.1 biosynthetic-type acetolactate synthase large subunit [Ruminococcus sp.]
MVLNGSDIIIECLLEQGVDTVFGYPGGAVLNIYDALYKYSDRITHILTSHEQGASHAADGYARTTGKTGVVIATSGPGATNLVTGLATAYMDSIPMVAITGNVATSLLGLDSFQEVDITGITMPITKHNFIVKDINELAGTIRDAFYIANEGRKGPVLIDIPKDITAKTCEFENKIPEKYVFKKSCTLDDEIKQAAAVIKESKKPFIYAGGGVSSCDAVDEFKKFVYTVDAPVSLSLMGQCAFDNTDSHYTGMLGMHGTKTSALALENCDLMIVLGSRLSDRVSCNPDTFAKNIKIIHIDIDPAEINKNIHITYNVVGNLSYVLKALNEAIPQQNHSQWLEQIQNWKNKYPLYMYSDDEEAVLPYDVIKTLEEITDGKAVLSTEVGQHQMWTAEFYDFKNPRSFATSGGLGTMGYGLGAAIGAKVGNPDKTVINIAGDGSFYMNMNELSTLAKYNLPVIELVMNNSVLGMVRQWQKLFYGGRFSNTTLEKNTDFEMLGKAFGINAFTIRKKSDIRPVLEKAIKLNQPVLIDCHIDKDINVLPMVPAGSSVYEPILSI